MIRKNTLCLFAFSFLILSCSLRENKLTKTAINFFPKKLDDLSGNGFTGNKLPKGFYHKSQIDTFINFDYRSEEMKYYKRIQIRFREGDSAAINSYVSRFELSKNKDSLFKIVPHKGRVGYKLSTNFKKGYILLEYTHPSYKNYQLKTKDIDIAPSASDN